MKKFFLMLGLMIAGNTMIHDDWLSWGGTLFVMSAGYIAGFEDGKGRNKISDHFRKLTKR